MNKQKVLLVLAILVIAGAGVGFAKAQSERPAYGPRASGEQIELSGKVILGDSWLPAIQQGKDTYELMVPRYLLRQVELKLGEEVSVTGYKVPGPPWEEQEEGEYHLFVTKAKVRGQEYDLSKYGMGPGMRGRGGPRADEWGPPRRAPGQGRW